MPNTASVNGDVELSNYGGIKLTTQSLSSCQKVCLQRLLGARHPLISLYMASRLPLVEAEHPVGQLGHLLKVRVQRRRIEQNGRLRGCLLQAWATYSTIWLASS